MSRATYIGLTFGERVPWRSLRWLIAERMGWTLEYADSKDIFEVMEGLAVWHGKNVAAG